MEFAFGRGIEVDEMGFSFSLGRIKYSCEIKLATASGFFLLSERASRFRSPARALDVGLKLFAAYLTMPPMPPPVQLQLFFSPHSFDKGCRRTTRERRLELYFDGGRTNILSTSLREPLESLDSVE